MAPLPGIVIAWDVLMFLAILLLILALVPPLFSRHVIRRKTWHTLMLSLLVFSIGEIILIGNQQNGSISHSGLCLVQVAIIYSTPPLIAIATAAYSADIYISIKRMFDSDDWEDGPEPQNVVILVLAPWVGFFLVFMTIILVVGLPRDSVYLITQPPFYCHTQRSLWAVGVSAVTVMCACVAAVVLQAATGWTLYKNWITVQKISIASTARKYIHAFIRTIAFTAIAVIGIILAFVAFLTEGDSMPAFSMLLPLFPIVAAFVFGTYMDIMTFYCFWR